jgi:hypothetical protein
MVRCYLLTCSAILGGIPPRQTVGRVVEEANCGAECALNAVVSERNAHAVARVVGVARQAVGGVVGVGVA